MAEFTIRQTGDPGDAEAREICPHCLNNRWTLFDGVYEENCQCFWDHLPAA